jgi:flagellar assembly protein FliH
MALIKNAQADRMVRGAIVLDLGDVARQAEQVVQQAREEAGRIVARGRAEAQTLIDAAAEKGLAEGLAKGLIEGRAEGERTGREQVIEQFTTQMQQLSEAWTGQIVKWEADRADMLRAGREDVLALALAMGECVVRRIANIDPSVIEDQLAEVLAVVSRRTAATVRVNPEDRPVLQAVMPQLMQQLERSGEVSLTDDPQITRGGCVVTTAGGRIDATLEKQLERIVEALLPEKDRLLKPATHETGHS